MTRERTVALMASPFGSFSLTVWLLTGRVRAELPAFITDQVRVQLLSTSLVRLES